LRSNYNFFLVVNKDKEEEGEEEDLKSIEFVKLLHNFIYKDLDNNFKVNLFNTKGMHNPCIYCKYANIVG
jgi:hypothetical protein